MKWSERLYLGTWQFDKNSFKKMSSVQIEHLINFALKSGINRFDTASAYGGGDVEKILGSVLPQEAVIVTKVHARRKPTLDSSMPIEFFYLSKLIRQSVEKSLERLRRSSVSAVLLHNWNPAWHLDGDVLYELKALKKEGLAEQIGISLPNNFGARLSDSVLSHIDIIEAPLNSDNLWILEQLPDILQLKKEVLLRSLFSQGALLKNGYSSKDFLSRALALGTSVVVGMTTKQQIVENIKHIKEGEKNALV